MDISEWHRSVDDWVKRENQREGEFLKIPKYACLSEEDNLALSKFAITNEVASEDLIRHYADAIGDVNPLWRSWDYAKTTRYGRIIAPPKFLDFICPTWGGAGLPNFNIPGMTIMNTGNKHTWYKPIYAGDKFTIENRFLGVKEITKKERPIPRLFTYTGSRTYTNQLNEKVATVEGGAIVIAYGPENKNAPFPDIKRHLYTDKEIEEIKQSYDKEIRRGRDILYWENVNEGEELDPLLKGPLSILEMASFFQGLGYLAGFRLNHLLQTHVLNQMCARDQETNYLMPMTAVHLSDPFAKIFGMPCAIGIATQSEGNIVHSITNWMGDDGFLKRLDCQTKRINVVGDMNWIKGKVIRKYIDEGEHLVELALLCENQEHVIHMVANAVVKLISKKANNNL